MAFCMKCGAKLPDEAVFCIKCGSKLPEVETIEDVITDSNDKTETKDTVEDTVFPSLSFEEVSDTDEGNGEILVLPEEEDNDEDDDDIVRTTSYEDWEFDEDEEAASEQPEVNTSAEVLTEASGEDDDYNEEEDISKYFAGPDDDIEPPEELTPEEDGMSIEELSAAKRYHEELKAEHSNFIQNRLNIDPIVDTYFDDVLPELEEELKKINLSPIFKAVGVILGICALALYLIVMIPN